VELYTFDRKLRLVCLDAIERIEVALRASINNRTAIALGPHFHLEPNNFENFRNYHGFIKSAIEADHLCIRHYRENYSSPELPPIWALTEALSFGKVSRLYADLKITQRKDIARDFGWDEGLLTSWFRCLADFRNRCAHHERVWNARMLINMPSRSRNLRELTDQESFYARAVLMIALLKNIDPGKSWRSLLKELINSYPNIDVQEMGFPVGWESISFWST
jgi:abortive infection bacteriophage resistance protein